MYGLVFEDRISIVTSNPNRADIACFIGFIGRRNTVIPNEVWRWLFEQGWVALPDGSQSSQKEPLLDIPVPIDTWEVFDRLFAWEQRNFNGRELRGTTYLGAAVRSFFAQGGRKCYVVRVGDPWLSIAPRTERLARISQLIPGYPDLVSSSPVDRQSWQGVGHLFGLPDVSFLCLPDLPDAVSSDRPDIPTQIASLPQTPEQFVECSEPEPIPQPDNLTRLFSTPRCQEADYEDWARALHLVADLIARQQREVQLVAAVPIPQAKISAEENLLGFLSDRGYLSNRLRESQTGFASAFVQLVYPWVRTLGSTNLPEQLESPDAVLVGILSRNALTRGAFRSSANLHLADVYDVYPVLSREQLLKPHPDSPAEKATSHGLWERVSLFGFMPNGLTLLSDVTTSLDESYRSASVNRLVAIIVRAARTLGEGLVFEPSGDRLWSQLRGSLNSLLLGLLQVGALRGDTDAEAFRVRCDRSTMSQLDIDSGRVIAEIQFTAAAPLERITVVLAMDEGGQVSLISNGAN
jgi:hypothetical protein